MAFEYKSKAFKRSIYGLVLLIVLSACSGNSETAFELPEDAIIRLTGGGGKVWKLARRYNGKTRMNMGDCFLAHRETYSADGKFKNNSSNTPDCGPSLNADWGFVKDKEGHHYLKLASPQIPKLMGGDKDYKLFRIIALSDTSMILRFRHAQFSNKASTITDYWVPEDVTITDRDFHW